MRLMLMRYFTWSVDTMESVFNANNCDMWVLKKQADHPSYEICEEECFPARVPWASRAVRVIFKNGEVKDFTVVNYLGLEQPRTSQTEAALQQMIPGHPSLDPNRGCDVDAMLKTIESIDPNEVESIDWWCNKISDQAKALRTNLNFMDIETAHRERKNVIYGGAHHMLPDLM
eukprot:gene19733-34334_t